MGLCMALRTRAMGRGMEDHDIALRGAIAALGTDTTALTGTGKGTERGRGVPGRGSITGRGKGREAGAEGGMKSIEGQKNGNIMMKDIEIGTGRGLEILKGKES